MGQLHCLAFHKLQNKEALALRLLQAVDRRNVGMVQ
jgi:hypothetical protein